jgi:hypothetical protein
MLKLTLLHIPKDFNLWRGNWKTSRQKSGQPRQCIQDEKDLIARSQQEAENLTAQLKIELPELSVLSWQIVSGKDKDDVAVIAEADRVRLEAIAAINEFLQ